MGRQAWQRKLVARRDLRSGYVPDRGDAVWLSFDPHAGDEQSGRWPAVVLSPRAYNSKAGVAILCPITTQVKGYPFEVALPPGLAVSGVALADQVRSLDWRTRKAALICQVPVSATDEILGKLGVLLKPN